MKCCNFYKFICSLCSSVLVFNSLSRTRVQVVTVHVSEPLVEVNFHVLLYLFLCLVSLLSLCIVIASLKSAIATFSTSYSTLCFQI